MLQKFWGSRSPPRGGVGDQHDVATHGENAVLVGLAPGKPTEQKKQGIYSRHYDRETWPMKVYWNSANHNNTYIYIYIVEEVLMV